MSASYIQANTNGRLHGADEPSISPLNRGFLYGDAIYEVWRTYSGVIFAWEEHWARLVRSAAALHLGLPLAAGAMLDEIRRTVAAFRQRTGFAGELYIRLQITRGGGAIGLDTALADRPDYLLLVKPCSVIPEEKLRDGLHLSVATALRRNPIDALSPAWKTGNYLNNILALREARARGADEVVILNLAGEVTEAAVSNIAFVRDGTVVTPPLSAGILGGITRDLLLTKIAPAAGVKAVETTIRPGDFSGMQECFLLSTTRDAGPVASIDATRFSLGAGTVTARLKQAYADHARWYADTHGRFRA
ncbi:MAG: aminotransferase class IV [Verrucomicrobia bacterium]|nr:aminotransferase class IV [Verrucomicrobiota bacterium]